MDERRAQLFSVLKAMLKILTSILCAIRTTRRFYGREYHDSIYKYWVGQKVRSVFSVRRL